MWQLDGTVPLNSAARFPPRHVNMNCFSFLLSLLLHSWLKKNKIKLIVGMCYFWNPAFKFCSVYLLIFIISIQLSVLEVSHMHFAMLINYLRRIFWDEHKNVDELVLIRTPPTFNIIKRMKDVLHKFKRQSLQPSNIIYRINVQLVILESWIWLRKSCQIPDLFFCRYSLTWQIDQLWWFIFCIFSSTIQHFPMLDNVLCTMVHFSSSFGCDLNCIARAIIHLAFKILFDIFS
jgi:hypothetical protein